MTIIGVRLEGKERVDLTVRLPYPCSMESSGRKFAL